MSQALQGISKALGWSGASHPTSEVAIVIGNKKIVGWQSVAVTRSVEYFPNAFVLTAVDQYVDDPGKATTFPTGPGAACSILVGEDLLLTGFVDKYATHIVRACSHLNTIQREDLNQSSVAAIAIPAA